VLVHCQGGISRSASLCIAYLIQCQGLSYDAAFALVRKARPIIMPNIGFVRQLKDFEESLKEGRERGKDHHGAAPKSIEFLDV